MIRIFTRLVAAAVVVLPLAAGHAAELKVLSGNGSKPAIVELSRRFERESRPRQFGIV